MLVRILTFFRGYVSLIVQGHFIERFINVCTRRNIYLWDIKKTEPARARMKMSLRGFRMVRPIAHKTHTHVRIQKRHGFPIIMRRYRKRRFFVAGLVLVVVLTIVMSQFVWTIELVGNENVPAEEILMTLEEFGLKEGAFRGSLDQDALKNKALYRMDTLSWLWVELKGCKAIVRVKEKTPAPYMVPRDEPCDIIAAKTAVIKVVNAKTGYAAVLPGETVEQGQLLISGTIESELSPTRYVHSTGEVLARTWYEKTAEYPPVRSFRVPSDNQIQRHSLKLFGLNIDLFSGGGSPYEDYEVSTSKNELSVGEHFLGIAWQSDTYREYIFTPGYVSLAQNLALAELELYAQIARELEPGAQIAAKSLKYTTAEDGAITVTLTMEFVEQIGVQRGFEVPDVMLDDGMIPNM